MERLSSHFAERWFCLCYALASVLDFVSRHDHLLEFDILWV